eukprot:TRINITY_DN3524_c1_g1_i2.p1 TRINITY_DN3524_c1_g1~~TRINITY_DN3524_c1_g1_i2.p1  ORF type:complete len:809 (+),score=147.70 TRINITY_DN3524_c1_g1_i2:207-2633(+)
MSSAQKTVIQLDEAVHSLDIGLLNRLCKASPNPALIVNASLPHKFSTPLSLACSLPKSLPFAKTLVHYSCSLNDENAMLNAISRLDVELIKYLNSLIRHSEFDIERHAELLRAFLAAELVPDAAAAGTLLKVNHPRLHSILLNCGFPLQSVLASNLLRDQKCTTLRTMVELLGDRATATMLNDVMRMAINIKSDIQILQLLVDLKAKVHASELSVALQSSSFEVISFLLQAFSWSEQSLVTGQSGSPILLQLCRRSVDDARFDQLVIDAVEQHGANIHSKNSVGQTAIFFAKSQQVARLLLKHRAKVNIRSQPMLYSPLHHAVLHNAADVVSELLAAGANPHPRLLSGETPLVLAQNRRLRDEPFDPRIVELLEKHSRISPYMSPSPLERPDCDLSSYRCLIFNHNQNVIAYSFQEGKAFVWTLNDARAKLREIAVPHHGIHACASPVAPQLCIVVQHNYTYGLVYLNVGSGVKKVFEVDFMEGLDNIMYSRDGTAIFCGPQVQPNTMYSLSPNGEGVMLHMHHLDALADLNYGYADSGRYLLKTGIGPCTTDSECAIVLSLGMFTIGFDSVMKFVHEQLNTGSVATNCFSCIRPGTPFSHSQESIMDNAVCLTADNAVIGGAYGGVVMHSRKRNRFIHYPTAVRVRQLVPQTQRSVLACAPGIIYAFDLRLGALRHAWPVRGIPTLSADGLLAAACTSAGLELYHLPRRLSSWTPESHRAYPLSLHKLAMTLLCMAAYDPQTGEARYPNSHWCLLPIELLLVILAQIADTTTGKQSTEHLHKWPETGLHVSQPNDYTYFVQSLPLLH